MSTPVADAAPPAEAVPDLPPARRRLITLLVVAALVTAALAAYDASRPDGPPKPPPGSWTLTPHTGLGAWVDAYDWSVTLGGATPAVGVADIDTMADSGVQTIYLQTAHRRAPGDVLEPARLQSLIDQAHRDGMHVVAWYLPTFEDPGTDLRRLEAAAALDVDGLAVDIESTAVVDPVERNQRVLDLSRRLRAAVGPDKVLAAITLSAVHVQVVNPAYWPGYPYADLAKEYDVLMPMAYWSLRVGDLKSGARYVADNLTRLRAAVGPDEPIHVIGGIADGVTTQDLDGMVAATKAGGAIGGSLYDWATSTREEWARLAPLRDLHR